jgi:hypothetical protein
VGTGLVNCLDHNQNRNLTVPDSFYARYTPKEWYQERHQWWIEYFGPNQQIFPASPFEDSDCPRKDRLSKTFLDMLGVDEITSERRSHCSCVLDELVLKHNSMASIVDARKVAHLAKYNTWRGELALVPASAQLGDQFCLLTGSNRISVIRDEEYIATAQMDETLRSALEEPPGSNKKVKHARIVGECFVDKAYDDLEINHRMRSVIGGELLAIY